MCPVFKASRPAMYPPDSAAFSVGLIRRIIFIQHRALQDLPDCCAQCCMWCCGGRECVEIGEEETHSGRALYTGCGECVVGERRTCISAAKRLGRLGQLAKDLQRAHGDAGDRHQDADLSGQEA